MKTKANVTYSAIYGWEINKPLGVQDVQRTYGKDESSNYYLSSFLDIEELEVCENTMLTLRNIYNGADASYFQQDFENTEVFEKYEDKINKAIDKLRSRIIRIESRGYSQGDFEIFYIEVAPWLDNEAIEGVKKYYKNYLNIVEYFIEIELERDYEVVDEVQLWIEQEFISEKEIKKELEKENILYDLIEIKEIYN